VLTVIIRPDPVNHRSAKPYDHFSLLATLEDMFGVARLGQAAQATPMSDLIAIKAAPRLRGKTS
jgi:hypothetical protein